MTVIVTIPSRQYTPQTLSQNFTIPANTKQIKATLSRESWPAGPVGGVEIDYPDGTLAIAVTFNGGTDLNRDGSVNTQSGVILGSPSGDNLPQGQYKAVVNILQTLTTAVLVERF